MLKFVKGDMFADEYDIRVNTVNCVGVMGTGVALAFKSRYPAMFRDYKKSCGEGRIRPGQIDVWRTLTEWIINFPTKRHWRNKSSYEDIELGLDSLREYLESHGRVRVALPALGCGHGGLDWTRVASMIEAKLSDLDAEIFVFEPSDSRAIGERVEIERRRHAATAGLNWHILDSESMSFPTRLRETGVKHFSVIGDETLFNGVFVAVLNSLNPDSREAASALACVEALARAGVTLSFTYGNRLSHALASKCISNQAKVILWTAQEVSQIKVPAGFQEDVYRGRLAIASITAPNERWSHHSVEQTELHQSIVARAILLTGPRQNWPPMNWKDLTPHSPVFYLWYQGTDQGFAGKLQAIGARRIGRKRETGAPSITPILEVLAKHGWKATINQD